MTKHTEPRRYPYVTKTLRPEQPGTLKLVRRYGDALLCVRYRDDPVRHRRCTTIELVIDERPAPAVRKGSTRLVELLVPLRDRALLKRALAQGAKWIASRQRWVAPLHVARNLKLDYRHLSPPTKLPRNGQEG